MALVNGQPGLDLSAHRHIIFPMRSTIILLFSWIILSACPASADDLDIRAIGLLAHGDGGCTATLIEPDLVLTAAHCVQSHHSKEEPDAKSFSFHPATKTGQPGEAFKGTEVVVHPIYLWPGISDRKRFSRDLALIKLARPVPASLATPIKPGPVDAIAEKGFVISFRGPNSRARQRACPPIKFVWDMLQIACEVNGGESGAPYLALNGDGLTLVAVVSARLPIKHQVVALTVVLDQALPSLFEAYQSGN